MFSPKPAEKNNVEKDATKRIRRIGPKPDSQPRTERNGKTELQPYYVTHCKEATRLI